jgi:hypothetical protein
MFPFRTVFAAASLVAAAGVASAQMAQPARGPQLQFPAASPPATLKQRVGLTDIEIVYSRPGVKGRNIMGEKVPYGEVWRTGANAATTVSFSTPVKLNGQDIPAGKYALYTIPAGKEWTVIIYRDPAGFGAFAYDPKNDLARFKATPVQLDEAVETFAIDINDIRDDAATINLSWERVRVPIRMELNVVGPIVARIEAAMAGEGRKPYSQAANFYLTHNLDLDQALAWAEMAIAERPAPNTTHLKAKILAKMGRKDAALAAARESLALARKTPGGIGTEYATLNELLIESLDGGK